MQCCVVTILSELPATVATEEHGLWFAAQRSLFNLSKLRDAVATTIAGTRDQSHALAGMLDITA